MDRCNTVHRGERIDAEPAAVRADERESTIVPARQRFSGGPGRTVGDAASGSPHLVDDRLAMQVIDLRQLDTLAGLGIAQFTGLVRDEGQHGVRGMVERDVESAVRFGDGFAIQPEAARAPAQQRRPSDGDQQAPPQRPSARAHRAACSTRRYPSPRRVSIAEAPSLRRRWWM